MGGVTFEQPQLLLLLALPVLLAFREWVAGGHLVVLPLDHARVGERRWLRNLVNVAGTLPYLLLAVAIMVLAGPRIPSVPKQERVMGNILFCLDLSGSMGASFGKRGSRYDEAMRAIKAFTQYENRQGDAFGLTVFGNEVLHWVPVTKDLSAIDSAVPFIAPGTLPRGFGGTEIGRALKACKEVLEKQETGDRMVILLSDGQSADLSGGRDRAVANELRQAGITVYVISIAANINSSMKVIAETTDGEVFSVRNPDALRVVFEHIDNMEKGRYERTSPLPVDYYEPFTIVGLALAGIYLVSLFGLRYTPW